MNYDNIRETRLPDFDCHFYSINNLVLETLENKEQVVIEGNCFIFDFTYHQYFHTLHDKIGQYEFLKQYIPDLKLVPVGFGSFSLEHLSITGGALIVQDIMEMYDLSANDFYFLSEVNLKFKNVHYVYNIYNEFLKEIPTFNSVQSIEKHYYKKYHMEICRLVKNKFSSYITETKKEKIYISRKNKNKVLNMMKILDEKKKDLSITEDELVQYDQWLSGYGGDSKNIEISLNIRSLDSNIEESIEGFFTSLGYKIVNPELMSLRRQVNLFYNSTHIASINGTGCYNTIFSNLLSKVFIINTDSRYKWLYEDAARISSNYVYDFPQLDPDIEGRKFLKTES
jgi:hypothetical protein